tara:strand:- start:63 stop:461 length:399 start_codon:yes stop_codon:yes gene_type:complete
MTGTIINFPNPEEIIQRSNLKEQESFDNSINLICDNIKDFLNLWIEQIQPEIYENLLSQEAQEASEGTQTVSWFCARMQISQAFLSVCAEIVVARDSEIADPDLPTIKFEDNTSSFIELFHSYYKDECEILD